MAETWTLLFDDRDRAVGLGFARALRQLGKRVAAADAVRWNGANGSYIARSKMRQSNVCMIIGSVEVVESNSQLMYMIGVCCAAAKKIAWLVPAGTRRELLREWAGLVEFVEVDFDRLVEIDLEVVANQLNGELGIDANPVVRRERYEAITA